ncbi:MAG: hypothetical protein MHPSP_003694, partial [Paramarteilia canceri]
MNASDEQLLKRCYINLPESILISHHHNFKLRMANNSWFSSIKKYASSFVGYNEASYQEFDKKLRENLDTDSIEKTYPAD